MTKNTNFFFQFFQTKFYDEMSNPPVGSDPSIPQQTTTLTEVVAVPTPLTVEVNANTNLHVAPANGVVGKLS
jgi:hypothetical protein